MQWTEPRTSHVDARGPIPSRRVHQPSPNVPTMQRPQVRRHLGRTPEPRRLPERRPLSEVDGLRQSPRAEGLMVAKSETTHYELGIARSRYPSVLVVFIEASYSPALMFKPRPTRIRAQSSCHARH